MTKTPGEVQPPKHLTKAARDARKATHDLPAADVTQRQPFMKSAHASFVVFTREQTGPDGGF